MLQYIATRGDGDIFGVDFETKKISKVEYNGGIDYQYQVQEDGEFSVDGEKLFDVKAGDIILKMYSVTDNWNDKEFVKITTPELIDYFKRRAEWLAAKNAANKKKAINCYEPHCESDCVKVY